jgi:uncharacterized DUF497 family protein
MDVVFEWDRRKARINLAKHGVTFEEALTVFADPLARILDDPAHSAGEVREIIVGSSKRQRLLVVSFTEHRDAVRIIGARSATRNERNDFEERSR